MTFLFLLSKISLTSSLQSRNVFLKSISLLPRSVKNLSFSLFLALFLALSVFREPTLLKPENRARFLCVLSSLSRSTKTPLGIHSGVRVRNERGRRGEEKNKLKRGKNEEPQNSKK